jgi:hypothetical protein
MLLQLAATAFTVEALVLAANVIVPIYLFIGSFSKFYATFATIAAQHLEKAAPPLWYSFCMLSILTAILPLLKRAGLANFWSPGWLLEWFSSVPLCTLGVKCEFVHNFKMMWMKDITNHSHPQAAKNRNRALRSIQAWAHVAGLETYHLSQSNREKGRGVHGWHWAKDLAVDRVYDELQPKDLIVGVDVDYYLEQEQWRQLTEHGNPMLLYSFVPRQLAGPVPDGYYSLKQDNTVEMVINGSMKYRHALWSYEDDTLVFDQPWGYCVYSVDRRQADDHHQLMLLTCIKMVRLPQFGCHESIYRTLRVTTALGTALYLLHWSLLRLENYWETQYVANYFVSTVVHYAYQWSWHLYSKAMYGSMTYLCWSKLISVLSCFGAGYECGQLRGTRMRRREFYKPGNKFAVHKYTEQKRKEAPNDANRKQRRQANNAPEYETILWWSIAAPDWATSVQAPVQLIHDLAERFQNRDLSGIPGTHSICCKYFENDSDDYVARMSQLAATLYNFFKTDGADLARVMPEFEHTTWTGECPNYVTGEYDKRAQHDSDWKRLGEEITPPLTTTPATVPAKCQANSTRSVKGRVEDVANTVTPPIVYTKYAEEFVAELRERSGLGGKVVPYEPEVVVERQKASALQVARNAMVMMWDCASMWMPFYLKALVKSFMKPESVGNYNDPRNISTLSPEHNLDLSRFTMAIKDAVLKPTPWYAPAKTPPQVARRVANLASAHGRLVEADGSRFDGHISKWMYQNIKRAFYLAFVSPQDHQQLLLRLDAEMEAKGRTEHGLKYKPGTGTLSGSATTTDGNTVYSACIDFFALRKMGHSSKVAYDMLSIYGGDDILSVANCGVFLEVAKDLGMKYEAVEHVAGRDVEGQMTGFLGRRFPYAFDGGDKSMASVQDPSQIDKIHLTFASRQKPMAQRALEKARGLVALDAMNPLVVAWAALVERTYAGVNPANWVKTVATYLNYDLPYWPQALEQGGSWPQVDSPEEYKQVWAKLGVPSGGLEDTIHSLYRIENIDGLHADRTAICLLDRGPVVAKRQAYLVGDSLGLTPTPERDERPRTGVLATRVPRMDGTKCQPAPRKQGQTGGVHDGTTRPTRLPKPVGHVGCRPREERHGAARDSSVLRTLARLLTSGNARRDGKTPSPPRGNGKCLSGGGTPLGAPSTRTGSAASIRRGLRGSDSVRSSTSGIGDSASAMSVSGGSIKGSGTKTKQRKEKSRAPSVSLSNPVSAPKTKNNVRKPNPVRTFHSTTFRT